VLRIAEGLYSETKEEVLEVLNFDNEFRLQTSLISGNVSVDAVENKLLLQIRDLPELPEGFHYDVWGEVNYNNTRLALLQPDNGNFNSEWQQNDLQTARLDFGGITKIIIAVDAELGETDRMSPMVAAIGLPGDGTIPAEPRDDHGGDGHAH
jgi:hypothetical protein